MSGNKFECNEGIVRFFGMMEAGKNDVTKHRPELVGWNGGEGYMCKDSKDNRQTFKRFAEGGWFDLSKFTVGKVKYSSVRQ